jgi:predicted CXXCH cytochrome family protein
VRSVQVCGHCHGQRLPVEREGIRAILKKGDPYTPGEDLSRHFLPVTQQTMLGDFSFAGRFWADGSPRLTAYEYQGVLRSPCYLRGELTCLSCHTMHAGDPRGQLRPDLPGDAICTQCHREYVGARLAAHTRHKTEGSGSRCVACHMPPVVYGIMTWHPTHEISSPEPGSAAALRKPESCTLCHSGRSLAWASEWSQRYWPRTAEHNAPPLEDAERLAAPELARALFAGDVVYRTLAAERLSAPSPDPEVADRVVPLLAELLTDPYPNVRRTARNALARLTGRADLPEALDPVERRDATRRELQAAARRPAPLAGWPFLPDGALDRARLEQWKRERQEVPVSIGE